MNILALAGSNSTKSINKRLVTHVCTKFFQDHEAEILDLNDYEVPIFSIDREEASGVPEKITKLASKIDASDLMVISLAEHNASYSAAFKNVYDWLSRIADRKVFNGSKVLLMATSPGGRGGKSVLDSATDRFGRDGAELVGTFSLPKFYENLPEGAEEIVDEELKGELENIMEVIA